MSESNQINSDLSTMTCSLSYFTFYPFVNTSFQTLTLVANNLNYA